MTSRQLRAAAFFGPTVILSASFSLGGGPICILVIGIAYWAIGWRLGERGEPASFGSCLKCAFGLPFVAPPLLFLWALFAPDPRGVHYANDDGRISFLAQGLSESFVMLMAFAVLAFAPLMLWGWKMGVRRWSKNNREVAASEITVEKTQPRKAWPIVLFAVVALLAIANAVAFLSYLLR